MRFRDIPQFTPFGQYEVNIGLGYLPIHLEEHQSGFGGGAVLDLNPDFQRAHVWNNKQRTKFVEYILREIANFLPWLKP